MDRTVTDRPLQVRVDLGVMVMKKYLTLSRSAEVEPHYWMQFSLLSRTSLLGEILSSAGDTAYCNSHRHD